MRGWRYVCLCNCLTQKKFADKIDMDLVIASNIFRNNLNKNKIWTNNGPYIQTGVWKKHDSENLGTPWKLIHVLPRPLWIFHDPFQPLAIDLEKLNMNIIEVASAWNHHNNPSGNEQRQKTLVLSFYYCNSSNSGGIYSMRCTCIQFELQCQQLFQLVSSKYCFKTVFC